MSMPLDFQHAMTRFALGNTSEDALPLQAMLAGDEAEPMARVHRNNIRHSLRSALADNYPVTVALVGAEFFAAIADSFVERHPPNDPRLAMYGAGLGNWLEDHPALQSFPFVAEVARLEAAWAHAYRTGPDVSMHGHSTPVRNPSASVVHSQHDAAGIRDAALAGRELDDELICPRPSIVLVLWRHDTVAAEPLSEAEAVALENAWHDRLFNPADLARPMALGAYLVPSHLLANEPKEI